MATRRHSGRRIPTGQRRKLVWATTEQTTFTLTGNTTANLFDLLSNYRAAGGATQGITIIRTHIQIAQQTASPSIGAGVFMGLIVGDKTDTATQQNALAEYNDWMLYKNLYTMGTVSGASNDEARNEIDLRAKRKMQELGQTYWLVLQALTAQTTTVAFSVRALLALP